MVRSKLKFHCCMYGVRRSRWNARAEGGVGSGKLLGKGSFSSSGAVAPSG